MKKVLVWLVVKYIEKNYTTPSEVPKFIWDFIEQNELQRELIEVMRPPQITGSPSIIKEL